MYSSELNFCWLQKNEDIFELKIVKYNEDMTNEFHNELITEIGFTICYK